MLGKYGVILVYIISVSFGNDQQRSFIKLSDKVRVMGTIEKTVIKGTDYEAFRGIPYAHPPTGSNRFKPPIPIDEKDTRTIDGTKFASDCSQINPITQAFLGSEDCLYLNMYVPNTKKPENGFPVMVFIHGGGFLYGTGRDYGPDRFMDKGGVILITLNYRLGALGFLSLGDDVISGNMGIKDQLEALRWVKKNVHAFGGDDSSVTLFGNSAGSVSIMSLLIATKDEPVFHRVILQSGVFFSPFTESFHAPRFHALTYSNEIGCGVNEEYSVRLLECLQAKDVIELLGKQGIFNKFRFFPHPWKMVDDSQYSSKPFFPSGLEFAIKSGSYRKVSTMIGGTKDEGAAVVAEFFENDGELFEEINENYDIIGPTLLMCVDEADVTEEDSATANIIRLHYFKESYANFSVQTSESMVKMITDTHLLGPIEHNVKILTNNSDYPVYYYNYRYRGSLSAADTPKTEGIDLGVSHFDEVYLLFQVEGSPPLSLKDMAVSDKLIRYWTSFATHGTPSNKWDPVTDIGAPSYAVIDDSSDIVMRRESDFEERMKFIVSMNTVIESYRNFSLEAHPAIKAVMGRPNEDGDELDPSNIFHGEL